MNFGYLIAGIAVNHQSLHVCLNKVNSLMCLDPTLFVTIRINKHLPVGFESDKQIATNLGTSHKNSKHKQVSKQESEHEFFICLSLVKYI